MTKNLFRTEHISGKGRAIASLAVNTDQRSIPRPVDWASIINASGGDGSDMGAFELTENWCYTDAANRSEQALNGPVQFSFTNVPGASFTVLTSTNIASPLSNWAVEGG